MSSIQKGSSAFLDLLGFLPRVTLATLPVKKRRPKARRFKKTRANNTTAEGRQHAKSPLWSSPYKNHRPYYLQFHSSDCNEDVLSRQHLRPISLHVLQNLIDTNRINTNEPIDLTTFCLTGLFKLRPELMEGGFMITEEGFDNFEAKINIETQFCCEAGVAAIERNGGTVTTAYMDPYTVSVMLNPQKFFQTGLPIPKRMLPPFSVIKMYASAKNRGYLANPDEIAEERYLLAQKYGYNLPDIKKDEDYVMLIQKKDPLQIFYGLQPGWIVNMADKVIIKPKDKELLEYYNS